MNSNKRKNRGPLRTQRTRSVLAEGVYNNAHFMHSATLQIGNVVRIKTASGVVWEGVFKTFSSNFDVVLEVAAKVDNPNSPSQTLLADSFVDKLIFKSGDISTMEARDVDLEYPTKDTFQTDTAIASRLNGNTSGSSNKEEKELEPWEPTSGGVNGGAGGGGDNIPLELENANGWDANDMFRKNEQEYGVTSTFDQSLKGYTVPLRSQDTADYREAEAKAAQIANEIESQPSYKARLELENGDEEAAFAAVARPQQQEPNDKYIPPAKRKNQNSGKLVRSTPPPSSQGGNPQGQTTPSPKGANTQAPPTQQPPPQQQQAMGGGYPPAQSNAPPQHMPPPQQMNMAPPPQQHPNHGRPHSHTPPHGYGNQVRGVQGKGGGQMNGEAKPPMGQRTPRGAVYQGNNPPNVPPQPYQQEQQAKPPPPPTQQDPPMNHPRHPRDDTIKELHGFAQDFKLPPPVPPNEQPPQQLPGQVPIEQMAAAAAQQNKPPPPQQPPQQQTPPQQQPQQSISPQQDPVEKVTNSFKKSTLNPNAKEFVLNPAAKPFQPRSPSTPSASRPHTPQTPSPYIPATVSGPMGQPHMPVVMPLSYMMTSQPQYQPQPQGSRMRKIPMGQMRTDVTSQMQVAAATGQPLLAPPIQQFVYPPGINPQGYPQMHALRMYETPPQIQYLPPNHSNTPSPAQPPQYSTPGQGPQPPPQQYQAAPPPPQSHPQIPPIMCSIFHTQPHMMQNMQYLQQAPPPQPHIPVMLPPQHAPQPQQHGPAP